jgi:Tol biopolymer transport system component
VGALTNLPLHSRCRRATTITRACLPAAVALTLIPVLTTVGGHSFAYQRPSAVDRVSLDVNGKQFGRTAPSGGYSYGDSDGVSMSADGRFVAFVNSHPNTSVPAASSAVLDNISDLYLRDRRTHKTTKISIAANGGQAQGSPTCEGAHQPAVSADGRYVAFTSCFTNLLPRDPSGITDMVFLRDVRLGTTTLVSVNNTGLPMGGHSPTISDDGQRIAFAGTLAGVGGSCTPGAELATCEEQNATFAGSQVFVRDLRTHKTILASAAPDGTPANGLSQEPTISPDGRFVLFLTTASNLSTADLNTCPWRYATAAPTCPDAYLHDLKTGANELISVGLDGRAGSAEAGYRGQMISRNDRYIAFQSTGYTLVPAGTLPGTFALYVRDRLTGRTARVDVDSSGAPAGAGDTVWSLSPDGRYLAYGQFAYCKRQTIGFHDLLTGATTPVGLHDEASFCSGQDFGAVTPEVSTGGRFVAFVSMSSKLTPGDSNKIDDVFVQDRSDALAAAGLHAVTVTTGSRAQRAGSVLTAADVEGDTNSTWSALGGDLDAATVAYRPASDDLFVRLAVAHMPMLAAASPIEYALDFAVNGAAFTAKVTCAGLGGGGTLTLSVRGDPAPVNPTGLPAHCGTTGQEVVWAVPMAVITTSHDVQVRPLAAFTEPVGLSTGQVGDRLTF